ncbi:hypothetical protein PbB2_02762 [Candidatus Phycosocius bacilliformis]|uniref:Uncharacterized protein n=1 Tax=Candidatus Phycosocius bacilliformis TaxID=1445552 RepID=A0A2P2EDE2_9PROT|nr:hypothetical protein [Candidatus Phycosocius bacilliformis]GBF59070.1 hypothetical protein PbB2_02762 [Candidatus Phycosocius bacilliformis]
MMVKTPKLSHTLIKGFLIGLIPFGCAAIDSGSIDFPATGLAIILVPVFWMSLIIWHLTTTKAAKAATLVQIHTTTDTSTPVKREDQTGVTAPKLSHTLLKALTAPVVAVGIAEIGRHFESSMPGIDNLILVILAVPPYWVYLLGKQLGWRAYGYNQYSNIQMMGLSGHEYVANPQIGPPLSAFEHNQLSAHALHMQVMTRAPDYSLGPDSGMYRTTWT